MIYSIPSYRRAEKQETLEYLRRIGVEPEHIYIFVQTPEDRDGYSKYSKECTVVYRDANSVTKARNNILNYFGGETDLLMLDDDISQISVGSKGLNFAPIETVDCLDKILEKIKVFAATEKAIMYGFYPVYNEYFMNDTYSLKKPVNTILGFPRGFNLRFNEKWIAKEDIELCGRILAAGGNVLRVNNVAFKAKHRTNPGGTNEVWKSGINRKYSRILAKIYPAVYAVKSGNDEEIRTIIKDERTAIDHWI